MLAFVLEVGLGLDAPLANKNNNINTNNTSNVQKEITLNLRMFVSSSRNVGGASNLLMMRLKTINVKPNSLHVGVRAICGN